MEAKRIRVEYNDDFANLWLSDDKEPSLTIERMESRTPPLKKIRDIVRKRFIEPAKNTFYEQYKRV